MKNLLKKLFCKHEELEFIENVHGDMINHLNCRSIWKCCKCGKIIFKKDLWNNEELRFM